MKKIIPITDEANFKDEDASGEEEKQEESVAPTDEKEAAAMKENNNDVEMTESKNDEDAESPAEKAEDQTMGSEPDLTDQLQRLAAEFENYRKKNAGEFMRGRDAGVAAAVEAILPAMDSIASALCTAGNDHDIDCLTTGVQAVERQLLSGFAAMDVKPIEVHPGDRLDPKLHEVMLAQDSDEFEPGSIISVVQQGYTHKDRLLRAAKVIVSKDKDE